MVDWTNLDKQHTIDCVDEECDALVMGRALIDETELDAFGGGLCLGQEKGGRCPRGRATNQRKVKKKDGTAGVSPKFCMGTVILQTDSCASVLVSPPTLHKCKAGVG